MEEQGVTIADVTSDELRASLYSKEVSLQQNELLLMKSIVSLSFEVIRSKWSGLLWQKTFAHFARHLVRIAAKLSRFVERSALNFQVMLLCQASLTCIHNLHVCLNLKAELGLHQFAR